MFEEHHPLFVLFSITKHKTPTPEDTNNYKGALVFQFPRSCDVDPPFIIIKFECLDHPGPRPVLTLFLGGDNFQVVRRAEEYSQDQRGPTLPGLGRNL